MKHRREWGEGERERARERERERESTEGINRKKGGSECCVLVLSAAHK